MPFRAWLQRRVGLELTPTLIFLEKGRRPRRMLFRTWLQRRVGLEPTPTVFFSTMGLQVIVKYEPAVINEFARIFHARCAYWH